MGDVIPFPSVSTKRARRGFRELDIVVTTMPVTMDRRIIPPGSQGTITKIDRGYDLFDIEFYRPFHCVVTLRRYQIR